jgi:predicted SprT family Zn-dependent metalloprotease
MGRGVLMGPHGWGFAFNKQRRGMGLCRYATRTIELSIYLVDRNGLEEVRDTILHEIAHALVGPGHGADGLMPRRSDCTSTIAQHG